jgi:acyl-CoA reductase-like NAD-dependent aldehyde dehydrogenase
VTPAPTTVSDAVDRALAAYADLQAVAEEVEDEWMYIQDLTAAHRERLEAAVAADGDRELDPATGAAVEAACDEIGRIVDPHRAIDWLSTFPSVVAISLGMEP